MAGVVPTKRSASGRKQWTLHEGPRSSLKRLRNQLASDGCPESQVVLAKQLLDGQCGADVDTRENARLGVYWLIKASEQGNTEATELLKKCLLTGKGITEHNYLDVKSCISMTQDEKLARKAAREMFISLSNGEDYITSEQLQKHMLSIDKEEKSVSKNFMQDHDESANGELVNNFEDQSSESEEEADWMNRHDGNNEKLTEDHLVAAAVNYSNGQLPLVNRILCLSDPNLHALDHLPVMQRSVLHPVLALKILYYRIIKFLGRQPFFYNFLVTKTDTHFLLLMFLYALLSSENLLLFLPMLLYYVTFVVMIVTTFQMLQSKRDFLDFRVWSGLFISYSGGSLNAEEAEFQFIRNNLKPYGHFFLALLLNLMMYPAIAEQWIPQSELTIVAFCLTFMTLIGFMPKKRSKTVLDTVILFSFAINVIAKYPYETDPVVTQGWRFLDLKVPTFAGYIIGNGIEFCISYRLLFYIFIPIVFLQIAARENWRGSYKNLIPHCVTLSWLQIVIISSQGATMFGLLRGTLALVGVVLFLPLVGLTSIILPAAALTKWLAANLSYSVVIFVAFMAIGLIMCWLVAKTRFKRYTGVLQVSLGLLAFLLLLNADTAQKQSSVHDQQSSVKPLTWEIFQKFCHQPAWEDDNIAVFQQKCINLANTKVSWEGYVNDIKITSITNNLERVLTKLPNSISQYLYCMYGDTIESSCDCFPELLQEDCNIFYETIKAQQKCSLEKYNVYTFEVSMQMKSGMWGKTAESILVVNNYFKNFTFSLKPNDHIWFKGSLVNDETDTDGILGGLKPHIKLEEIGCLDCHNSQLTQMRLNTHNEMKLGEVASYIYSGVKCVLNFLFNPIVIFR